LVVVAAIGRRFDNNSDNSFGRDDTWLLREEPVITFVDRGITGPTLERYNWQHHEERTNRVRPSPDGKRVRVEPWPVRTKLAISINVTPRHVEHSNPDRVAGGESSQHA